LHLAACSLLVPCALHLEPYTLHLVLSIEKS
jgi:hypothetical protein